MLEVEQYQTGITGSTAREIAASAEAAIRDERLGSGETLPTVRALARQLGTSPATVNSAYRILRERGLVIGEGRRGTRVAPRPALRAPQRPRARLPRSDDAARGVRDLAIGLPDPELLPDLGAALARIDVEASSRIAGLESSDPGLLELAAAAFEADGIPAEAVGVVSGAFDGIERVLRAHLRPGDRVLIEDPAYVSIRDLLLALGLVAVPVEVDDSGLLPAQFAAALAHGVEAAVIVPRAQNPLGSAFDREREAELRELLAPHPDVLLVEDDHAGVVSGAPCSTLLTRATQRWAVIRSVSKFLHPDLRVALMAGDDTTIARVEGLQALGPRWVSHVLQALVAELLRDPEFESISRHAADVYTARRGALVAALADRGVGSHGRSGLNVWVPVREEAPVVGALLDAGWRVLAGERFRLATPPGLRVTIANLDVSEADEVAEIVASVEHAGRPRRAY
ncbi:MAG TPA: aminotransferase class I/II-fold pyridoxal phosphate-dependent enzyme [Solirubrobacteraceae bacterium]|jgi:DNA-binding transcriptional MocR family regulator